MKRSRLSAAALAVLFALVSSPSHAQIEAIPPTDVVVGQSVDLFFLNDLAPEPNRKVLQFSGEAVNNTSVFARLDMQFDYVDAAGNTQFITLPNSPFAVPPGATAPIDGIHILDFCPEQVSLHFELVEGEVVTVAGDFAHNCITIPEPSALVLLLGLTAPLLGRPRRR